MQAIFQPGFWMEGVGVPTSEPIFIIGMMRCGSTLLETMLHSHPEVWGAGENSAFNGNLPSFREELVSLVARAQADADGGGGGGGGGSGGGGATGVVGFESGDVAGLVRSYGNYVLRKMRDSIDASTAASDAYRRHPATTTIARVVDKMLFNFRNIGFIHMVFPTATIIHVTRDPMDLLLSCWRHKFDDNGLEFALHAEELALSYFNYLDLMHHFRTALPGRIVDVLYEELVTSPENVLRTITARAGIDFHPNMLAFKNSSKTQQTHSRSQVRQGLYSSHLGAWRRYAVQLRPLIKALNKYMPALRRAGALPFADRVNWGLDSEWDYEGKWGVAGGKGEGKKGGKGKGKAEESRKEASGVGNAGKDDQEEKLKQLQQQEEEGWEYYDDEEGEYYDDDEEEEEGHGKEKEKVKETKAGIGKTAVKEGGKKSEKTKEEDDEGEWEYYYDDEDDDEEEDDDEDDDEDDEEEQEKENKHPTTTAPTHEGNTLVDRARKLFGQAREQLARSVGGGGGAGGRDGGRGAASAEKDAGVAAKAAGKGEKKSNKAGAGGAKEADRKKRSKKEGKKSSKPSASSTASSSSGSGSKNEDKSKGRGKAQSQAVGPDGSSLPTPQKAIKSTSNPSSGSSSEEELPHLQYSPEAVSELRAIYPAVPRSQAPMQGSGPGGQFLWDLFTAAHKHTHQGSFAKGIDIFERLADMSSGGSSSSGGGGGGSSKKGKGQSLSQTSTLFLALPELYRGMATAMALSGQLHHALSIMDRLLRLVPNDFDGLTRRAEVLTALGQAARARIDLDKAIAVAPSAEMQRELLVSRGMVLFRGQEFRAAYKDFQRAIDLPMAPSSQNDLSRLYNYLGKCEQEFGDWRHSIESQDRSLELQPSNKEAHYDRAISLISASIWEPAIKEFARVIEIDPQYKNAYGYRGLLYQNLGRPADAVASFNQALKIDPVDPMVLLLKAVCLHASGRYADSIATYTKLMQVQPGHYCVNRREVVFYQWARAHTPLDTFNMDAELNPYTKMGVNKQTIFNPLVHNLDERDDDGDGGGEEEEEEEGGADGRVRPFGLVLSRRRRQSAVQPHAKFEVGPARVAVFMCFFLSLSSFAPLSIPSLYLLQSCSVSYPPSPSLHSSPIPPPCPPHFEGLLPGGTPPAMDRLVLQSHQQGAHTAVARSPLLLLSLLLSLLLRPCSHSLLHHQPGRRGGGQGKEGLQKQAGQEGKHGQGGQGGGGGAHVRPPLAPPRSQTAGFGHRASLQLAPARPLRIPDQQEATPPVQPVGSAHGAGEG